MGSFYDSKKHQEDMNPYPKLSRSRTFARRAPSRVIFTIIVLTVYICSIRPIRSFASFYSSDVPVTVPVLTSHLQIPPKIWQTWLSPLTFPSDDIAPAIASWPVKNRDYQYHLLSFQGAEELVKKHYAHRPHVRDTFLDLQFPVLRSDLIRYLTLESEGGVYSDVDTICRYPLHEWIPQEVANKVRAIVGIEYDKLASDPATDDSNIEEMLQFCQWTMAASPGHPIMTKVVNKVVANLHEFARNTSSSLATLQPTDSDVVKITGPVVFTAAVMESIAEQTGQAVSHLNFTGTTSPRLFGDLLVLSVDGFATGQTHSGASRGGEDPPTSLARHLWKGTWKHDWSN